MNASVIKRRKTLAGISLAQMLQVARWHKKYSRFGYEVEYVELEVLEDKEAKWNVVIRSYDLHTDFLGNTAIKSNKALNAFVDGAIAHLGEKRGS